MGAVTISLSQKQRDELEHLIDNALGDLSHEIADTDNPSYRAYLRERREVLQSVQLLLVAARERSH
jgi:hypothetical protein